jgi:exonuclease VII small subunit
VSDGSGDYGIGLLLVIFLIIAVVSCSEKEDKVKELEKQVQELNSGLEAANKAVDLEKRLHELEAIVKAREAASKPPAEAPIK